MLDRFEGIPMRQTNVVKFPSRQLLESDRLRLYRDEPGAIVILSTVRAGLSLPCARKSVGRFHPRGATTPFPRLQETISPDWRRWLETKRAQPFRH
jgi:hypothetical protein